MDQGRGYEWTERTERRLRTLWAEGTPAKAIGNALGGLSDKSVAKRAAAIGLPPRVGQGIKRDGKRNQPRAQQ